MKAFTAQSSDLSGPGNPDSLWSPRFLALKLALENREGHDNVLTALYDWLSTRRITPSQVDKILHLPDPDSAYQALVSMIGGKFGSQALPDVMRRTLRAAIQEIAKNYADKGELELDAERRRLLDIRSKFTGSVASESVVNDLLQ